MLSNGLRRSSCLIQDVPCMLTTVHFDLAVQICSSFDFPGTSSNAFLRTEWLIYHSYSRMLTDKDTTTPNKMRVFPLYFGLFSLRLYLMSYPKILFPLLFAVHIYSGPVSFLLLFQSLFIILFAKQLGLVLPNISL